MSTPDIRNSIAKNAYRTLRQLGWANGSLYVFNRLLALASKGRWRVYKYYLVAQPVPKAGLLPAGRGKKIEVRLIGEQEKVVCQFPRPANVIEGRFEQGAKCLGAFKEGRFIGFLWLLLHAYREDEVRARYIPLPSAQAAWDFDVYVEPDFRLGPAFPRLWDEANRLLREKGVRWSCSRISAINVGSVESHARLGSRSLGSAVFFCGVRWQMTWATIPPYFHLSTHPDSIPDFRLNTRVLDEPRPIPNNKTGLEGSCSTLKK